MTPDPVDTPTPDDGGFVTDGSMVKCGVWHPSHPLRTCRMCQDATTIDHLRGELDQACIDREALFAAEARVTELEQERDEWKHRAAELLTDPLTARLVAAERRVTELTRGLERIVAHADNTEKHGGPYTATQGFMGDIARNTLARAASPAPVGEQPK